MVPHLRVCISSFHTAARLSVIWDGKLLNKPVRTIKKISLAEQRELTAIANRVERHQGPKVHRCRLCKVQVPVGYDQRRGRPNFDVHLEGHLHKFNLAIAQGTWKKGCFICPNKTFNNETDYRAHVKGKVHTRHCRLDYLRQNFKGNQS